MGQRKNPVIPTTKKIANESELVKKLINAYPDSIAVTVEYGTSPKLDFVETIDRLADNVMSDFDINRQKFHFATVFENKEECARYLATYLYSIAEMAQEWIDENYYVQDGELYFCDDDDENENYED